MGCGIGVGQVAIVAATDDFAAANYHGADRDFARFQCALGGAESLLHEQFIHAYCVAWVVVG
jgi:hypothetical protein